jgi:LemA protein
MSYSAFIWVGCAILVFWCVGLYNRLMRIRAQALVEMNAVEQSLKRYVDLGKVYGADTFYDDQDQEWILLCDSLHQLETHANDQQPSRLDPQWVQATQSRFDSMQDAWTALAGRSADLAGSAVPEPMRLQWETCALSLLAARQRYNDAVLRYTEALEQFPARMAVGAMKFEPLRKL